MPPDEHDSFEDAELLRALDGMLVPLPPEDERRRSQAYREAGVLTPEILALAFMEIDLSELW